MNGTPFSAASGTGNSTASADSDRDPRTDAAGRIQPGVQLKALAARIAAESVPLTAPDGSAGTSRRRAARSGTRSPGRRLPGRA
jgi:hypothetical protein